MKLIRNSILFLIFFSFLCFAEGKIYYVNPFLGDDSFDGSEKSPWKTLEKVRTSTEKGDKIYLLDFDKKWGWSIYDWPEERIYYTKKISQYGITWYFDNFYQVGRFINNDFWVIGPINIIKIDPTSIKDEKGNIINGSMLNPSTNKRQGYDSRAGGWDPKLNVGFEISELNPLKIEPDASLISTKSLEKEDYGTFIETAAILTILKNVPEKGSFRPPYFGNEKIFYNVKDIDYSKLKTLSREGIKTPKLKQEEDTENQSSSVERIFERPWIDHLGNWIGRSIHPKKNMQPYGRDISKDVSIGALMLILDFPKEEKERLLIRFIQIGIDLYGIIRGGGIDTWIANGGHCMGRKFPIMFAGFILNNKEILKIAEKSGSYLYTKPYGPGKIPPDYIAFQEDEQTFYVSQEDVDRKLNVERCEGYVIEATKDTIKVNHPASYAPLQGNFIEITDGPGKGQRRYIVSSTVPRGGGEGILKIDKEWEIIPEPGKSYYKVIGYEEKDIGLPEWGIRHAREPNWDNPSWYAEYRDMQAISYAGWILASHVLGIKDLWNHPALFDYVDRDMGRRKLGGGFIEEMWKKYREQFPPVWKEKGGEK
ncbi:MAG: hypothetical protein ACK4F0_07875 [Candidatus Ratteibacteria bacterium]